MGCEPQANRTPDAEYTAHSAPSAAVTARFSATTPSSPISTRHVVLLLALATVQQMPQLPGSTSASESLHTTAGEPDAMPRSTARPKEPAMAISPAAFART